MDVELQEEDAKIPPFTPTQHLRDGFLSFTEFLLRNVEEWSKPHPPWPPPPPPIAFSGSDRFIKGRLPHRTFVISASLSSLFDDGATSLLDACNHGDEHADHDYTLARTQRMTCDATLSKLPYATRGDDHRAPTASTHCNTSIDVVSSDNAPKSDMNCMRFQADDSVQGRSSNGMVDVSACSTDNALEVNADCMPPKDSSSVFANEMADVATCNTDNLLAGDSQCAQESGLPNTQPNSLHCTMELDGSVYVPDNASEEVCLPLSENSLETLVEGGNVVTGTPVDAVVGHSLLLECESRLPPSILTGDVAKLSLSSPSKSPSCNNFTGGTGGVPELSLSFTTKSHNDNNLIGDMGGASDLSLLSRTKSHNDNILTGNADGVAEVSLPSQMKTCSVNTVTSDADGLSQLSLLSPRKSGNANNLTCDADGLAELSLPPSTKSHNVKILQNTVMEAPLRQDEQVDDDLEEGELSERLPVHECLETVEDGKAIGEAEMQERHPLDATGLEPKSLESTTDDEMNQPISLFISRYRTRSSVNPSTRKLLTLHTNRDLKKERKTGNKRKIEDQELVLKEIIGADMAVTGKSRHGKSVPKGSCKVARTCARGLNDYNGRGILGVGKVSIGAKVDTSEAEEVVQKKYGDFTATQAGRDQVMGTPTVVSSEREGGASHTHSEQNDLVESEHFVTPKKHKACLPMVVEGDLSTIDAGNDQKFSQAEVASKKSKGGVSEETKKKTKARKKSKRGGSEERRKKRQEIKHRKWDERQGKLSVKPCVDKQKEKKACHFYVRGKCDKGVSCIFSHDITPITKSEICKYFINSCCLKGDDCPYSHALSTFPCKYFHIRGKCVDADSCRFSHQPISEEAKQKLLTKIEQEQQVREEKKVTISGLGRKHAVSPHDLELFPLGIKHTKKTPLKGKDTAASKISSVDTTGAGSTHNISEISMLISAKKAASKFTRDPTGPSADKSSEKSQSIRRESGGLLAVSSNATMTQERKAKVDVFLQSQLNNSYLMRKSKLGVGSENLGGCYTLLNQPRALSMGQTSLLKAPNMSPSNDMNAKAMGLLQFSEDLSQPVPKFKPTICMDIVHNSDLSVDQQKSDSNGKSIGIDASVSRPSVLGPSLLDILSMSQRATVPNESASTSGLLSTIINAAPKRSTANVILDRILKG